MPATLNLPSQNAAMTAIKSTPDAGTTDATGDVEIYNAAGTQLLGSFNLNNPAFGVVFESAVGAQGMPKSFTVSGSSNPSTLGLLVFRNRDNQETWRVSFSVSNLDVHDGDLITFTSISLNQPP